MTDNKTFIDELVNIQQRTGYSDRRMAERIGCCRANYQAVRTGVTNVVSNKFLKKSLKAFPQLRNVGVLIVRPGITIGQDKGNSPEKPYKPYLNVFIKRARDYIKRLFVGA